MIEILFTESAAGCMKAAKALGRGDGLRGSPEDVFCFPLSLDIGTIDGDVTGDERIRVLQKLFSAYPFGGDAAEQMVHTARKELKRFKERAASGERIRIWYSCEPDEACGWLWFASVLQEMTSHGPVSLVRLPQWDETRSGTVVMHTGFGEVVPEDLVSYVRFEREAPSLLIAGRQFDWTLLVEQNAELRAVISGKVLSVPDNFYDFLIVRAIDAAEDEFHEAMIIGNVLGRSQIGMSDGWLALRINEMVETGQLEVVEESQDEDAPAYHRVLRKKA